METLRLSLHKLEGLLEECAPMMSVLIEKAEDKANNYGAVLVEVGRRQSTWNEKDIEPS